jgi:L-seryl-tRNA(Ser) seleniumtransferase
LAIAALEATLRAYLNTDRILEVNPALRLLSRPLQEMESMARSLADFLTDKLSGLATIKVENGYSQMESISMAPERFPTKLVSIEPKKVSAEVLSGRLRSRMVPIFGIVRQGHLFIDLRTVQDDELDEIVMALTECCQPWN